MYTRKVERRGKTDRWREVGGTNNLSPYFVCVVFVESIWESLPGSCVNPMNPLITLISLSPFGNFELFERTYKPVKWSK